MKKVTSAETVVMANHYKNIPEAEGIPCQIRNEHLNQIYGEMPFTEVWPDARDPCPGGRHAGYASSKNIGDTPVRSPRNDGAGEDYESQHDLHAASRNLEPPAAEAQPGHQHRRGDER